MFSVTYPTHPSTIPLEARDLSPCYKINLNFHNFDLYPRNLEVWYNYDENEEEYRAGSSKFYYNQINDTKKENRIINRTENSLFLIS